MSGGGSGAADGGVVSVLLVEDDRETSTIYSEYLVSQGYHVLATADAMEGIRLAERERPAVIMMDLSVPGMDGSTAMRRLKAEPSTAGIPILAMTASSLDRDRRRAYESGCDAFVEKPCRPPELLRTVEALLARGLQNCVTATTTVGTASSRTLTTSNAVIELCRGTTRRSPGRSPK